MCVLPRHCGALVADNLACHEVGDTRCFQHRDCAVAQTVERNFACFARLVAAFAGALMSARSELSKAGGNNTAGFELPIRCAHFKTTDCYSVEQPPIKIETAFRQPVLYLSVEMLPLNKRLLTAAGGIHASKGQKVDHAKTLWHPVMSGQGRYPIGLHAQERVGV
jgi:hypothetical protein